VLYSIDYYSFTIPTDRPFTEGMFHDNQSQVLKIFCTATNQNEGSLSSLDAYTVEKGARFYSHRMRHAATDIAISWGETNSHILVEFAGKACNNLDAIDALLPIIRATSDRASRIDFSVDIECQTDPIEFISSRANKSFKSSGSKRSPTGRTEYIGGRTSERMARVYRYNPPHPRHNFLRAEAEYKGGAAKAASKHLLEVGVLQACLDAHQPFGWTHSEWQPDTGTASKIAYTSYKPADASTVRWLYDSVAKAARNAAKKGILDLDEWVAYIKSEK
jgi:hypothetical protein